MHITGGPGTNRKYLWENRSWAIWTSVGIYLVIFPNYVSWKGTEQSRRCCRDHCSGSCTLEDKMFSVTQVTEYLLVARRVSHLPRNGWFALTFWRIAQCTQRRHTTLTCFDISRIWKVSCQLWENKVWYLGIRDILYPSKAKLKRKKIHHRIDLHRDNNQEPRECKRKEPPRIFTTEF